MRLTAVKCAPYDWRAMALEGEQEFSIETAASQLDCFETIIDFESYRSHSPPRFCHSRYL